MSVDTFTVADHIQLDLWGIADAPMSRPRSAWTPERVLEAAADGTLTAPELASPDSPDEISFEIDGRIASQQEVRAVVELLVTDFVAWTGRRIALTTAGREVLSRWMKFRPIAGGGQ